MQRILSLMIATSAFRSFEDNLKIIDFLFLTSCNFYILIV